MPILKRNIVVGLSLLFIAALAALKYLSPLLIQTLFRQGHYDLLNWLAGAHDQLSMGFYLGEIEQRWVGPLTYLGMGLVFTWLASVFLRDAGPRRFALAVLAFLVLIKFEVLFFPVYGGDAVTGPFTEGIWLSRHGFNFAELARQPGYKLGGPRVYLASIYPSFLAAQMRLFRNPRVFLFVNHLLVFMLAAGIVTMFRQLMSRYVDRQTALLAALVLLFAPLFHAQAEMINMEIPGAFFALGSCYFLIQRRLGLAGISALLCVLIKGSGIIAPAAFLLVSGLAFFFDERDRFKIRPMLWAIVPALAGILVLGVTQRMQNDGTAVGNIRWFSGVLWGAHLRRLSAVFAVCCLIFGADLLQQARRLRGQGQPAGRRLFRENYAAIVIFIYAIMWFVLFANYTSMTPRYKILLYPFITFCVCLSVSRIIRARAAQRALLLTAIVFALISSYGMFEELSGDYYYVQVERSLEYRAVLHKDILVAKEIMDKYSGLTIGAPSIMAQILAYPELGYVPRPLDVVAYGISWSMEGMRVFKGLQGMNLRRTVWVGYDGDLAAQMRGKIDFPVDPKDKVLTTIHYGKKEAILFVGGVAIEKMWRLVTMASRARQAQAR